MGGATTIGALYTGRGPVCGITTRRAQLPAVPVQRGASGAFAAGVSISARVVIGAPVSSFALAAISAGCVTGDSTTGGAPGVAASGFSATGGSTAVAAGVTVLGAAGFTTVWAGSAGFAVVAPAAGGRWRLYNHSRWHNCNDWPRWNRSSGCLGHDGASRRLGRDGRRCLGNDRWCLPRLRHNLSWFRARGSRRWRGNRHNRRRWLGGRLRRDRCNNARGRQLALASLGFLFLLLGQNSLHHVSRFGNVRKIDLGRYGLGSTR